MATKKKISEVEDIDYSLNDCLLRGRVSAVATDRELPSGEHVVEFRSVRRRFWQGPAGLASRWQIEGESITRL